jgi:hypothetical protein
VPGVGRGELPQDDPGPLLDLCVVALCRQPHVIDDCIANRGQRILRRFALPPILRPELDDQLLDRRRIRGGL